MTKKLVLSLLLVTLFCLMPSTTFATESITPDHISMQLTVGNAQTEIDQLKLEPAPKYAFKISPSTDELGHVLMNGNYTTPDGNVITIKNVDGYTFDWSSKSPVTTVMVKAGRDYFNVYTYQDALSGTGCCAAVNPASGKPFAVSHVTFGYNEATTVQIGVWLPGTPFAEGGSAQYFSWPLTAATLTWNGIIIADLYTLNGSSDYKTLFIQLRDGVSFVQDGSPNAYWKAFDAYRLLPSAAPALETYYAKTVTSYNDVSFMTSTIDYASVYLRLQIDLSQVER